MWRCKEKEKTFVGGSTFCPTWLSEKKNKKFPKTLFKEDIFHLTLHSIAKTGDLLSYFGQIYQDFFHFVYQGDAKEGKIILIILYIQLREKLGFHVQYFLIKIWSRSFGLLNYSLDRPNILSSEKVITYTKYHHSYN